jgi:hypothetical protein
MAKAQKASTRETDEVSPTPRPHPAGFFFARVCVAALAALACDDLPLSRENAVTTSRSGRPLPTPTLQVV